MYSGSDSTESQKYPQWALNPSAYQNMANDQVDWAALAQQWIIMKEAGPPPIPGEPKFGQSNKNSKINLDEEGEAPMEVENEKEDSVPSSGRPNWSAAIDTPPPPGAESWNWSSGPQPAGWTGGWNNSWTPPGAVPPSHVVTPVKTPLLPTPNSLYSPPPDSGNDNAVPFGGYNTNTTPASSDYNTGYWTSTVQSKEIKPHNKRYSKVNVPIKATVHTPQIVPHIVSEVPSVPPASTLDAAKRKQLPAWIREGLEKMEKDKLKQIEKEREKVVRDEYTEKIKQSEKEKFEILKTTIKEQQQKSKFDSDEENEVSDEEPTVKRRAVSPKPVLTADELMLKVRKTMTEILLSVTNQYIEQICKEEHQRFIKKIRASDQLASAPSGAILSAKLGLGVYNDGSSSSDEEEDEEDSEKADSDSDLKDTIRRRMQEFSKTEREIEDRLADAESRKNASRGPSRSPTPDTNDNESQVDARPQDLKPNASEEEEDDEESPPPKPRSPSTSSDESENYLTSKVKTRQRSSSRESNSSSRNDKKSHPQRYRSRSGSRRRHTRTRSRSKSAEKKYKSSSRYTRSPPSSRKRRSRSRSSRRDSTDSKRKSRRSRSHSGSRTSRSRRSRSSSYRRSSRKYSRRSKDRSNSRSRYRRSSRRTRSRSDTRSRRRRSRSSSTGRGKRSHRR